MVTLTIRNIKKEKLGDALIKELEGYKKENWAGDQETQRPKHDGLTMAYYKKGKLCIRGREDKAAEMEQLLADNDLRKEEDEKVAPRKRNFTGGGRMYPPLQKVKIAKDDVEHKVERS